jgi:hypothetical protein
MSKAGWMLAAAMLAAAPVTRAQTQDEPLRWQMRQSEEGVVLAYEQPDTDFQPIFFGCRLPQRRFSVVLEQADGLRPGQQVPVEFASEGGRVSLRLRVEHTEMGDFLRAELPYDPALGRVLAEGRTLRVTAAGRTERFPLANTRQGVAALAAACQPR